MSENNTNSTKQTTNIKSNKKNKAELLAKLHSKIDQKKIGRLNNKQKNKKMDSYMTKMGITPEQSDHLKEMLKKTIKTKP